MIKRDVKNNETIRNARDLEVNGMGAERTVKMDMTGRSNVAIAAAITAYARMGLTSHMMDPNNAVFYHDTDSIVVQKPRSADVVGVELGQMKREYRIEEGIFAGPKRYSRRTEEGKEVVKAKGYGSKGLKFQAFKGLREGEKRHLEKEY